MLAVLIRINTTKVNIHTRRFTRPICCIFSNDFVYDSRSELDELSTGPIPIGTHEFVLEAPGPNPALIPTAEVVGVTVILITCSYREQEFVRIGKCLRK